MKITAIKQKENELVISFRKSQNFISFFIDFLKYLNLTDNIYVVEYQYLEPKIKEWIDGHDNIYENGYDIDILYGQKKIILIIRTNEKNREKIMKFIRKNCSFN